MKLKLLLFFSSLSVSLLLKKEKFKVADKNYDQFAYIDAIKIYENIAEKGYKSTDLFQKLGDGYYFNGEYTLEVVCEERCYLRAEQKDCETKEASLVTSKIIGKTKQDIALSKKIKSVTTGDDLAKVFGISNIYFDLDKSNINAFAAQDLAKTITVMNEYPTMKIAIRSHTDSRASAQYNLKLSERRAQATM